MSNYVTKVAAEVYAKFKKLDAGADFGLVYSEFINGEEFFENFNVLSTSRLVINKNFDIDLYNVEKVIEYNVAMVTCIDQVQCNFFCCYA